MIHIPTVRLFQDVIFVSFLELVTIHDYVILYVPVGTEIQY